jgi:hypothetical protein
MVYARPARAAAGRARAARPPPMLSNCRPVLSLSLSSLSSLSFFSSIISLPLPPALASLSPLPQIDMSSSCRVTREYLPVLPDRDTGGPPSDFSARAVSHHRVYALVTPSVIRANPRWPLSFTAMKTRFGTGIGGPVSHPGSLICTDLHNFPLTPTGFPGFRRTFSDRTRVSGFLTGF